MKMVRAQADYRKSLYSRVNGRAGLPGVGLFTIARFCEMRHRFRAWPRSGRRPNPTLTPQPDSPNNRAYVLERAPPFLATGFEPLARVTLCLIDKNALGDFVRRSVADHPVENSYRQIQAAVKLKAVTEQERHSRE